MSLPRKVVADSTLFRPFKLPYIPRQTSGLRVGTDLQSIQRIYKVIFRSGPHSLYHFLHRGFSHFELPVLAPHWLRYLKSLKTLQETADLYDPEEHEYAKRKLAEFVASRWAVKEAALKTSSYIAEGSSVHLLRTISVLPQAWFDAPPKSAHPGKPKLRLKTGGSVVLIPQGPKRGRARELDEFQLARCSISHQAGLALAVVQAYDLAEAEIEASKRDSDIQRRLAVSKADDTFDAAMLERKPVHDRHLNQAADSSLIQQAATLADRIPISQPDQQIEVQENPFVTTLTDRESFFQINGKDWRANHPNLRDNPEKVNLPISEYSEPRLDRYLNMPDALWLSWLPRLLRATGTEETDYDSILKHVEKLQATLRQIEPSERDKMIAGRRMQIAASLGRNHIPEVNSERKE